MDIERLTFPEAVEFLADQLHMPLPELQNDPAYEQTPFAQGAHLSGQQGSRTDCIISIYGRRTVRTF